MPLIFVDRVQGLAIMVVIRRELPRTNSAGPAATACRIAYREDSPLPYANRAADHLRLNRVHRFSAASAANCQTCRTLDAPQVIATPRSPMVTTPSPSTRP